MVIFQIYRKGLNLKMHWWNTGFGMGGFWMILGMIIIIVIAAVIIYFLISQAKQSPRENNTHYHKPATILKERYARGEITREEYEQMLKDIGD